MKNVQDIYPVTPMQQFMLLHGLGQSHRDTLFNQFVFDVDASLSPDAFRCAWEQVLESHVALRTAFIWKGVDTPQQVVRETVALPFHIEDLTDLSEKESKERFEAVLKRDREQGFDFRRAPLMRFTLVKMAPARWQVIWSSHHLIVDRWCIDQLMDQFQFYYRARLDGAIEKTRRAPSFKEYVAWIHQQDTAAAQDHWKNYLAGFSRPISARQLIEATTPDVTANVSSQCELGQELTQDLRALSRRAGITLSCLIQAAVGMALNVRSGCSDIVFGLTVAGRPPELTHVEEIVGSFISTLPVRIPFTPDTPMLAWLKDLNSAQFANAGRDFLSPPQFRACVNLPVDRALFEVLMVWLTQTRVQDAVEVPEQALRMVPVTEQFATAYPLTLSIIESPNQLALRLDTPPGLGGHLSGLLDVLREQIAALANGVPERSLAQFSKLSFRSASDVMASATPTGESVSFAVSDPSGVTQRSGREDVEIDAMIDLLQSEWQAVLKTTAPLSTSDDFFALGGDSLKAASLHARLEAATRKAIPLLSLFEHTTIASMANALMHETWPLRDGIAVPLRTQGSEAPLFCVASPEVNTLGYAMLARHLPERRNLILLQAPPSSDELEQLHPDELTVYAARYIEALRAIQPTGPYTFLSMCSGAHIAYHMLAQLEQEGEEIQFAGVINTWSLYSISWRFYLNRLTNVVDYYVHRLAGLFRFKRSESDAVLASGDVSSTSLNTVADSSSAAPKVVPAESAVGLNNPWISRVGFAHLKPPQLGIETPITVFRLTAQPYWRTGDDALGWSKLTSSTHLVHVDGDDHDAILREPYVQQIAVQLDSELERANRLRQS